MDNVIFETEFEILSSIFNQYLISYLKKIGKIIWSKSDLQTKKDLAHIIAIVVLKFVNFNDFEEKDKTIKKKYLISKAINISISLFSCNSIELEELIQNELTSLDDTEIQIKYIKNIKNFINKFINNSKYQHNHKVNNMITQKKINITTDNQVKQNNTDSFLFNLMICGKKKS